MSQTDFLTGFLSKESVGAVLDKLKAECGVDKSHFSMLVLDLDRFKTYNDKYGHLCGDDMLRYFAGTLRMSLESLHTLMFRFGGDEFIIVFPGKSAKEVYNITRDILITMKKRPFLSDGRMYKLGFSAGIATYPNDGRKIDEIIRNADKAMYFSKAHGRGRVTIYGNIFRKTVKKILVFSAGILLVAGIVWHFNQSPYKGEAMRWLKQNMGRLEKVLVRHASKIDTEDLDIIYLKSGRALSGTILRDDKDSIELSLSLESGRGTVTINRSDIGSIGKRQVKDGKQPG
jgi:diguanylate cyclase (GGDEF)-like protein